VKLACATFVSKLPKVWVRPHQYWWRRTPTLKLTVAIEHRVMAISSAQAFVSILIRFHYRS